MPNLRLPHEWTRHEATWLTWPHSESTWPGCLDEARQSFAEMIRLIVRDERAELCVLDDEFGRVAASFLQAREIDLAAVGFHSIPTNDSWVRDYGPLWVRCGTSLKALDWRFNAWGGKYPPWDLDDAAGEQIARTAGHPVERFDVVLEGGSIDIDEDGCLLTTRQNVDAPNRGPGRGVLFIETIRDPLGVADVIVLGDGIVGDDTDGHVDDITRFAPGKTIVTAVEPDRCDENHEPLQANLDILRRETSRTGHRLVELPMPAPQYGPDGLRLPASHANFYICNAAVLMPAFGGESDRLAQSILQELFEDRPVVSIDARALVVGLGACHCLTMQQPAI